MKFLIQDSGQPHNEPKSTTVTAEFPRIIPTRQAIVEPKPITNGCRDTLTKNGLKVFYDGSVFTPGKLFLQHMRNPQDPVTFENIAQVEGKIYGKVDGIPVTLSTTPHSHTWNVAPSQTKRWNLSMEKTYADVTYDGIWEWYPSIGFEYMSEKFWEILGYEQRDMEETPESWIDKLHADDREKAFATYENHVKTKGELAYSVTVRYIHRDEKVRHILCRGVASDWMPDGTPWRVIGTHTDVTLHIQRESIEAKSKFIARMSHEIRTPLVSILNECEQDTMDRIVIKHSCDQLLRITNDILELHKMDTPQALRVESINLFEHLQRCMKRHDKAASDKSLRIRLMLGSIPTKVEMDIVKFNQIIDNLVTNAIKYSDRGKITLDVDFVEGDSILQVEVCDQGRGIPRGVRDTLFDEFVQGDSTMEGVGIGLSICRNLARMMEGDVVVEKTSPDGTTMLFTSKAKKLPDDTDLENEIILSKVMIVDDMRVNRAVLKKRLHAMRLFDEENLSIAEACNGQEALELFKNNGGVFDLILMDCLMPILDGFKATVKIHDACREMGLEAVPVVAITASVSQETHSKCYSSGMSSVVTKPYTVSDLITSFKSVQTPGTK